MKVLSGSGQFGNELRFELMKSAADCVQDWATKESNSAAVISRGANEDLDSSSKNEEDLVMANCEQAKQKFLRTLDVWKSPAAMAPIRLPRVPYTII
jgi:hypothetical protein